MAKAEGKTEFQRILDAAERQLGQKQAVAEAIGITPSRYTKVYGGEDYSLSVANCLKLAKVTKRTPATVLRAAGKADVAALLDELYGESGYQPAYEALFTDVERLAHEPHYQESVFALAHALAEQHGRVPQSGSRSGTPVAQTPARPAKTGRARHRETVNGE